MPDTRPVWLTREQRDEIDSQGFEPEVVALWDAAPADPVRIAAKAIHDAETSSTLNRDALRLLRALGMPGA